MLWYNTPVLRRSDLRKQKIFYHTHIGTDRSGVTHDVMEAHDPDVVEKPEREDMKNVSNHH